MMVKSLSVVKAGKVEGHEYSTTSVLLSQENENDEITMNYNFAMKEVILNVLNSGKLEQVLMFYHLKSSHCVRSVCL